MYEGELPETATALPGLMGNAGIDLIVIGLILLVIAVTVVLFERKRAR